MFLAKSKKKREVNAKRKLKKMERAISQLLSNKYWKWIQHNNYIIFFNIFKMKILKIYIYILFIKHSTKFFFNIYLVLFLLNHLISFFYEAESFLKILLITYKIQYTREILDFGVLALWRVWFLGCWGFEKGPL